jgi:hypothetical protein
MLRGDGGADRRREQQRHALSLALIPFGDEPERIGPHLRTERPPGPR